MNLADAKDLSKACIHDMELWPHRDEDDEIKRDEAVARLADMLARLIKVAAKNSLALAPVIAIGCPGLINEDGSIAARRISPAIGKAESSISQAPPACKFRASGTMKRWWSCTTTRWFKA